MPPITPTPQGQNLNTDRSSYGLAPVTQSVPHQSVSTLRGGALSGYFQSLKPASTPATQNSPLNPLGLGSENNVGKTVAENWQGRANEVMDLWSPEGIKRDTEQFGSKDAAFAQAVHRTIGAVLGGAFAPVTATVGALTPEPVKQGLSTVVKSSAEALNANPTINGLLNAINNTVDTPAGKQMAAGLKTLLEVLPVAGAQVPNELNPELHLPDVKGAIDNVVGGASKLANKGMELGSNLKETISPTKTVDETVGQVLQGKPGDIASGKSAFTSPVLDENGESISEPLDTTGIKQ